MKKIMMLCVAIGAMLISCSKDYEEMIVGTWNCVTISYKYIFDNSEHAETNDCGESIVFYSDGVCSTGMTGYLRGNRYLVEDDYLVMIDDNSSKRYKLKIESISSSSCILVYREYDVDFVSYDSPEGSGWTGDLVITYTLKRIE